MGRPGISYTEVAKACDQLIAANKTVTVDNIRGITGSGSKGTLLKLKKQWEALGQQGQITEGELLLENEEKIEDKLSSLVSELRDQVLEEAKLVCKRNDENNETKLRKEQDINAEIERRYESLDEKHSQLKINYDKLQSVYDDNNEQLKQAIKASTRAEEAAIKKDEQIQLLQDQIKSLEDKHKQVRDALEHFRAAMIEQREKDQNKWDQLQNDYQNQITRLENTLSDKNSEISDLHQANGQLAEQSQGLNKQLIDKDRQLTDATKKLNNLEPALKESNDKVITQQERITELTVANAKLEQAEQDKTQLHQRISDIDQNYQNQITHYQKLLDGNGAQIANLTGKLDKRDQKIKDLEHIIQNSKSG